MFDSVNAFDMQNKHGNTIKKKMASKLLKSFNVSYLGFHRWLFSSFSSEVGLYQEISRMIGIAKAKPDTKELVDEFGADIKDWKEGLFQMDAEVLDKIPIFQRMNIPSIYARLTEDEKKLFWKNLTSLVRYMGMLNACGPQMGTMEQLAMDFVKSNPEVDPSNYHKAVFDSLMNDENMSAKLIESFKTPGMLKSIAQNFGDLLRAPGQAPIDLSGLAAMVNDDDLKTIDQDFDKIRSAMKGGDGAEAEGKDNPLAAMSELFGQSKVEISGSTPMEMSVSSVDNLSDAVRKLTEKIKEEQAKKAAATAEKTD